jgi:hypothetical protein
VLATCPCLLLRLRTAAGKGSSGTESQGSWIKSVEELDCKYAERTGASKDALPNTMLSVSDTSVVGSAAVEGRDAIDGGGGVATISDCADNVEGAGDCRGSDGTKDVDGAACNGVCA